MMSLKQWGALMLAVWVTGQPAQAASPDASSADVVKTGIATPVQVEIAPMSDPAVQGAACLGFAAASMVSAYALGPMEALMLMSGAQHVATGPLAMFIPMFSILGGGACALGAAAMPSLSWLMDQSDNIAGQMKSWTDDITNSPSRKERTTDGGLVESKEGSKDEEAAKAPPPIRPMTETEVQSAGCVTGALAGLGASMASSPMEVAMLSSGATTIVSTTPLLGLGLLATIVGAGCGIGSLIAVPMMAFMNNVGEIGHEALDTVEQQVTWASDSTTSGGG
jgi:hypothetical protein